MPASYDTHRRQIESILLAWGMPGANAAETADILGWADLHGVDSHGCSLLPGYDERRRSGRINLNATPRILKETAVSALVDGDGGFGHVAGAFAMRTAIARAKQSGIGVVVVRHSAHFGACGYYSLLAAKEGLIGIASTTAGGVRVAPTGGAEPRLGTDPWSFAAPAVDGTPFLLDMATTTVAHGKVRNRWVEGVPVPPGWVLTPEGKPSTDPADAMDRPGFLTSLGGTPEGSSYKGYGLAMMVNILAGALSGATLPSDPGHGKAPRANIGHFFLAMDPGLFRDPAEFRTEVARFCDAMRTTPPVDPARPVMIAGDPERATAARRMKEGIPVGAGLLAKLRELAEGCGAPWLLGN
jgi:LDH2 family malate/lactate/ureidoglycolate dehydrogenase